MTNWYEQTRSMMEMWTKAQQQMMQNWMQMGTTTPMNAQMPDMGNMLENWQNMTNQSMQMWLQNVDPSIKTVAEQMLNSQQAMLQMFGMAAQSWQNLMPVLENGGDWDAVLTEQTSKIREMLLANTSDWVGAGNNINQLWQTYLNQWQNFGMPWMNAMQGSMPMMGSAMLGDRSALTQMTNLYWDAYQDTFGQLLQAPGIGYTRELDEKIRRAFAAWIDHQQASYEYQVVLADTWVKAYEQLMREIVDMTQNGQQFDSLRDFINHWSQTADHVFKDIFRSDAYVEAQSKLVNALMVYRVKQRDVNEKMLEAMDMPTRSEVDEANRRIYELRKEVKALKKQMAAMSNEKPKTSTRKRSTAKKTAKSEEQES